MQQKTKEWHEARRGGVGGSDAIRIQKGDWLNLWKEKMGLVEPDDLSNVLPVQIGIATESINLDFLERELGKPITRDIVIPPKDFMRSNCDGIISDDDEESVVYGGMKKKEDMLVEAKHTHANNTLEKVAEYYYPQLQHYMMHAESNSIYLSVIFGNNRHEHTVIESDPEFQKELYRREAGFWLHVQKKTEPVGFEDLLPVVPDNISLDGMIRYDMGNNSEWIACAKKYKYTKDFYSEHNEIKIKMKSLVPDDCRHAVGEGLEVKRNKLGRLAVTEIKTKEEK